MIGPRQVASTPHPHVSISMAAPLGPRPQARDLLEEDDMGGGGRGRCSLCPHHRCLRFCFLVCLFQDFNKQWPATGSLLHSIHEGGP